jgi:ubiquinone/menaquinone biosynthesis C-methylase UbiE
MESQLDRILEPEWMDTFEEADAYDRMDHSAVNRAFVESLLALRPDQGTVLDVGTGPGHIPIELATRTTSTRIVAVDAARHMLAYGRRHVERTGFADRVRLVCSDGKRLPFPDATFDAVMTNSIVHHIPDPVPCFRELRRVLKPDGALLIRDLHRPRDREELEQLVALHAHDAEPTQRQLFSDSLHASFTVSEVERMLAAAGFTAVAVSKTSDRHWTAQRAACA